MEEYLDISVSVVVATDVDLFAFVVNKGIDSRLEAFTKSKFERAGRRLFMRFHRDEVSILLRRMSELQLGLDDGLIDCTTYDAELVDIWIDDIILSWYNYDMKEECFLEEDKLI